MARSRLAALLAALALLAPASAFGQSAGDEQYADPFGGEDQSSSSQSSGDEQTPPASSAPTQTAQATATPAPAPAPAPAPVQATTAAQQLPRTGGDPITPAVAGFWLLLGGVALGARVRTRPPADDSV
jgi:hypothetical protein